MYTIFLCVRKVSSFSIVRSSAVAMQEITYIIFYFEAKSLKLLSLRKFQSKRNKWRTVSLMFRE